MKRQTYQQIFDALNQLPHKYVTAEMLSQTLGIYPDMINEALSLFNPVVTLDVTFNLKDLLPQLENYLGTNKPLITKKRTVTKTMEKQFASFSEFVYEKMTLAGIVDKNIVLSDKDLKLAKKLIQTELKSRKK
jgi:NADH/NAD ratio-sensing transcriptional regulator Rex